MSETPEDWRHRAQCRDTDPNAMQPEVASAEQVAEAIAVCAGCPVRLECRELAQAQPGGAYGVHAGSWWGDPPRDPLATVCGWCAEPMEAVRSTAVYCSATCRVAADRARRREAVPA